MQISPNLHFQVILQVELWPWFVTFDHMNIWRFPHYINIPSVVQIWLQLFKWGQFHIFSLSYNLTSDDLWPWYMTFDHMNIWRLTYNINIPSVVQIWLPTFQTGHFHIFQPILQLDIRWPLTLICDLWPHQQTRVHMLHISPSFGWNPSKHVEVRVKC